MKAKSLNFFSLIIVVLGLNNILCAQHLPTSENFKIESYFRNGEYERSLHLCNKILRKYDEEKIVNKFIFTDALFYKIKNLLVTNGRIESVLPLEATYLETLRTIDEDQMSYYAKGLGRLASLYANAGYQSLGYEHLDKAIKIAVKYNLTKISEDLKRNEIDVLNSIGRFDDAYTLAIEQLDYENSKITTTYNLVSQNANSDLKGSYTPKEYTAIKRDFADFLNLIAEIKYNKGDYIHADSLASEALKWIKANIDAKMRDVSAFDNRFIVIRIYEKLDQDDQAYLFTYNDIVNTKDGIKPCLDKKFHGYTYLPESKAYMDYEEYLARHYWSQKGLFNSGMKFTADSYYARHRSFYERAGENRNNINIISAELMELDKYLINNDFINAKAKVDSLIAKKSLDGANDFIPSTHPFRRDILLKSITINAKLGLKDEVITRIKDLENINSLLLVTGSPNDLHDKLFIALYNHQILGEYKNSKLVFDKLFINNYDQKLYPLHLDHKIFTSEYVDLLVDGGEFNPALKTINSKLSQLQPYKFRNPNLYALELIKKADILLKMGNFKEAEILLKDSKSEGEIYKIVSNQEFSEKSTVDQYFRVLTRKHLAFGDLYDAKKSMNSISNLEEHDFIEFAPVFVSAGKTSYIQEKLNVLNQKYTVNYGRSNSKLLPILENLAIIQAREGDFGNASKNSLRSLEIANLNYGNNSYQYANSSFINGTVASYFGDYKNAILEFRKSMNLYKSVFGDKNIKYARSLSEMSLVRLYNNDLSSEIEDNFFLASNIVKNALGYTSFDNASILKNQAFYYLETDQIDLAERDISQSIQILSDLGENEYKQILAENYRINAKIQQYNKEYKASENSFKKALGYYYDLFSDKNHLEITLTRSSLAQLYYEQGDRKDSKNELNNTTEIYLNYIGKYFSYLTEGEKKEFWKKINQDFEFYKTIAFENNNKREVETVYNNTLITKGILLNSSKQLRQAIVNSEDENLKKTFEEWSTMQAKLAQAISMSDDQLRDNEIELETLQKEVDKLEKSLSEKSSDFAQLAQENITWKDVRDKLKTNEYAIEIIRYHKYYDKFTDTVVYKALILGKDYNTPLVVNLTNGNNLDSKYLNYYRNTTKFAKKDNISFKAFYEPIYNVVGENATVYISLEGAYNLINLEAILMPDDSYVMDKNHIIIVSSTKDLVTKKARSSNMLSNKKALFIANPMFYEENISSLSHKNVNPDQPFKQLSGAEKEGLIMDSIFKADNWKSELLMWDDAHENIIKDLTKNGFGDISYLHISTHGFFEKSLVQSSFANSLDNRRGIDDPYLRAGLLFKNGGDIMLNNNVLNYNSSDGVLTAKEISTSNLSGVEICVLSACETGLGDIASGEGVYGLQRALLTAGVKIVIISLFKVDDEVTRFFMSKLGEKYIETNNSRVAMDFAKKETQKLYPEPIYWGSFIMVD